MNFGLVLIVLSLIGSAEAFLPDEFATLFRKLGKSHVELTECALNRIALQLLKDEDPAMPTAECGKAVQERIELCQVDGRTCAGFDTAVSEFTRANAAVDSDIYDPVDHFDAEALVAANERLILAKQAAYNSIKGNAPDKYETTRRIYGHAMHILQDFYAHSNWLELGNKETNNRLGHDNGTEFFRKFTASSTVDTCNPCERIIEDTFEYCDRDSPDYCELIYVDNNGCFLSEILGVGHCEPVYRCDASQQMAEHEFLTSGFRGEDYKPRNAAKCRHGGIGDTAATVPPEGGINKDTNCLAYSPHSDMHVEAAELAENATCEFLRELRLLLGDDGFSRLIGIQPMMRPTSDLGIVIDVTGSMYHEIEALKSESKHLAMQSQADYYVLAPFSDPKFGPVNVSRSVMEFTRQIDTLHPLMYGTGGRDPEEMCFSAMLAAVYASKATTPFFVFTDEPPKDAHLFYKLASLGIEKLYQYNFMLTQFNMNAGLYQELADLTGGMTVFARDQDMPKVTRAQFENLQLSSNDDLLLISRHVKAAEKKYHFQVDAASEELVVEAASVQSNGIANLSLSARKESGETVSFSSESLDSSYSRLSVLKPNAKSEDWQVDIMANGEYSLRVFAKRPETYRRINARILLGRLNQNHRAFVPLNGRPVIGEGYSISVEFPKQSSNYPILSQLNIMNSKGDRLLSLKPIFKQEKLGKFVASAFNAPKNDFTIQLEGNNNNDQFRHLRRHFFRPVQIGIEDISDPKHQQETLRFKVTNHGTTGLHVNFQVFSEGGQEELLTFSHLKSALIPGGKGYVQVEVRLARKKSTPNEPMMVPIYFVASYTDMNFNYFVKHVLLSESSN